ncbi:hypothetical protein FH972_022504 [Carpinus fangiana]|uniref:Trafficking protein particle complex subunit 11 domain-containing protein n=1 Tax=Carpinus fangiana TaxID=176857 RepID=A0A5N6KSG1_9ROSI|nr:hypothetical protein FH972_022504 [Carpinus fangiana]
MSLVEYHDPDGLFPLIQPHLQSRLPLRNLHWKSPSRPVRSIASLHVDFVNASGGGTETNNSERRDSVSILGGPQSLPPSRAQRHQIPGLRASPYLKLFILKCDDKETYKTSARKTVREWLRDHASSSSNQDNHDAYEWLIVHVVVPDTPAANEARWSRSSGSGDETPKPKSGASRWTGRGSSTILEKLKSDFNHSSKSAPDRVTQVKLAKDDLAKSTPASVQGDDEDGTWSDLVAKFKTLVLLSFNLRVAQYEEDVRQKDSQRSLPGWNFCTFFVLKEGLGLAFENVGLIEDALAVYDELVAGLDTTVEEQSRRDGDSHGSDFLPFSPDLEKALRSTLSEDATSADAESVNQRPLNASLKPYRELILSNNISVFDIKSYIFARQVALLLRLASPRSFNSSAREDSTLAADVQPRKLQPIGEVEDPLPLAVLCQRAANFSAYMGRLMREELFASVEGASDINVTRAMLENIISQLVLSWSFAVARQVLIETASPSFPSAPGSSSVSVTARTDYFPSRRSSLPPSAHKNAPVTAKAVYEDDIFSQAKDIQTMQPLKNAELANAASLRAEIYLFQRRILENSGRLFGFDAKIPIVSSESDAEKPQSEYSGNQENSAEATVPLNVRSFTDVQLRDVLSSFKTFKSFYRVLSDHAAWNYMIASRQKSAERLHTDMATLKYHERDYAAAAGYFNRLIAAYSKSNWQSVESRLLIMHAKCLKALNRRDEHLRILTTLLAKAAASQQSQKHSAKRPIKIAESSLNDVGSLLAETIAASKELPYEYSVPMMKYFDQVEVDRHIALREGHDGFRMSLKLKQTLVDSLKIDVVKIQLVNKEDGLTKDIWLQSDEPFELDRSSRQVWTSCNVSVLGSFIIAKVVLSSGKIGFTHEYLKKSDASTPLNKLVSPSSGWASAAKQLPVKCFPRREALTVKIENSPLVWVEKQRSLQIVIDSGANDVQRGSITMRANTGGLRLFTTEASSLESLNLLQTSSKPGLIEFEALAAESQMRISIPWDLERSVSQISVKLEVDYITRQGSFSILSSPDLDVDLPIDVNVQDLFKEEALISQFLLKPVKASPIHILSAVLQDSDEFEVSPASKGLLPMNTPSQPTTPSTGPPPWPTSHATPRPASRPGSAPGTPQTHSSASQRPPHPPTPQQPPSTASASTSTSPASTTYTRRHYASSPHPPRPSSSAKPSPPKSPSATPAAGPPP